MGGGKNASADIFQMKLFKAFFLEEPGNVTQMARCIVLQTAKSMLALVMMLHID